MSPSPTGLNLADFLNHDSSGTVKWASGRANPPLQLADTMEEVRDLSTRLRVSFNQIKCCANGEADCLDKEGIGRPSLIFSSNSAMAS